MVEAFASETRKACVLIDTFLAVVIGGAALASFVQGLSGFAFSLAALSVWTWAVDPQTAAPMAVFGSLVGQLVALPLTWKGAELKRLAPFVLGGLIGVPLGVYLLGVLDPAGFKLVLGNGKSPRIKSASGSASSTGLSTSCWMARWPAAPKAVRLGLPGSIGAILTHYSAGAIPGTGASSSSLASLRSTSRGEPVRRAKSE